MLTINNLKWDYAPFVHLKDLSVMIKNKLEKDLLIKVNLKVDDTSISFVEVDKGHIFISTRQNLVKMRTDDPRVKKLGRSYLQSKRLTEEQYMGFFSVLHSCLDDLGLSGNIILTSKKYGKDFIIRKDKTIVNEIPEVNSFPKEKL